MHSHLCDMILLVFIKWLPASMLLSCWAFVNDFDPLRRFEVRIKKSYLIRGQLNTSTFCILFLLSFDYLVSAASLLLYLTSSVGGCSETSMAFLLRLGTIYIYFLWCSLEAAFFSEQSFLDLTSDIFFLKNLALNSSSTSIILPWSLSSSGCSKSSPDSLSDPPSLKLSLSWPYCGFCYSAVFGLGC